jgi:hypothetical protein
VDSVLGAEKPIEIVAKRWHPSALLLLVSTRRSDPQSA